MKCPTESQYRNFYFFIYLQLIVYDGEGGTATEIYVWVSVHSYKQALIQKRKHLLETL